MKKITFAFALFSAALNAQDFPQPYCSIADPDQVSIEEITMVDFNNNIINNSNTDDVLIDFTSSAFAVNPDEVYSLKVYGNTYGNFDTDIVAFIDWNDNGILNDPGEVYPVGTLTNSNGSDGVFVETQITVPSTATPTAKRVRITKIYTDPDSVAIVDPCAISFDAFGMGAFAGFGQALDFTLLNHNLSNPSFDSQALKVYPNPANDVLNIVYKSNVGTIQIYNQLGQQIYTDTDLGSEVTLDVSSFANGVYIVKIFNTNESKTFKLIKR